MQTATPQTRQNNVPILSPKNIFEILSVMVTLVPKRNRAHVFLRAIILVLLISWNASNASAMKYAVTVMDALQVKYFLPKTTECAYIRLA